MGNHFFIFFSMEKSNRQFYKFKLQGREICRHNANHLDFVLTSLIYYLPFFSLPSSQQNYDFELIPIVWINVECFISTRNLLCVALEHTNKLNWKRKTRVYFDDSLN